jgi:hypothetical protein
VGTRVNIGIIGLAGTESYDIFTNLFSNPKNTTYRSRKDNYSYMWWRKNSHYHVFVKNTVRYVSTAKVNNIKSLAKS